MRHPPSQAAAVLALAIFLCCLAAPAGHAQVTVEPRALDQLQPGTKPPATSQRAAPAPAAAAAKPRTAARAPRNPDGPHQILPPIGQAPAGKPLAAKPLAKPGTPPAVPPAAPPAPVLPPPIAVPMRPIPPPPPPPVTADAPGVGSSLPGGLRVTFGDGRAELNPETLGALRALAHAAPEGTETTFNVTAYSAGTPDDPSTARRLSLSRALAVRSVLLNEGIPSARIYVKALGAAAGDTAAPPDRADVVMDIVQPAAKPPAGTQTAPTQTAPAPAGANQKAAP